MRAEKPIYLMTSSFFPFVSPEPSHTHFKRFTSSISSVSLLQLQMISSVTLLLPLISAREHRKCASGHVWLRLGQVADVSGKALNKDILKASVKRHTGGRRN